MVVKLSKAEKKVRYDKKLCLLLDEYGKVLIAAADNVGSNQLQSIRRGLRGDSVILMGKNTLIRRCIRFHTEKTGNKDFLNLLPLLVGNVGLIFTKGDLKEVSEEVAKYKVFLKQLHLGDLEEVLKILSQDQRENFKKIFRCLHFQADDVFKEREVNAGESSPSRRMLYDRPFSPSIRSLEGVNVDAGKTKAGKTASLVYGPERLSPGGPDPMHH
ncbi:60S acidic ribosomal protein P0-like [Zingiber officinale]|uniref:60S acidic ribosomal protein P0-like n=1 Tax=Zingiber officinale TaxID=94328 RepID=UPI001C4D972A|nr:60S acidic ribosomal protein P0-like [Zingiber officinale]